MLENWAISDLAAPQLGFVKDHVTKTLEAEQGMRPIVNELSNRPAVRPVTMQDSVLLNAEVIWIRSDTTGANNLAARKAALTAAKPLVAKLRLLLGAKFLDSEDGVVALYNLMQAQALTGQVCQAFARLTRVLEALKAAQSQRL